MRLFGVGAEWGKRQSSVEVAHKTQPGHYLWANRHDSVQQIINRIKYNYEICSLFAWGAGHVAKGWPRHGEGVGGGRDALSMQRTELIRACN